MNVLFDLDGTLTDSKEGIVKSVQYAMRALNQPLPDASSLDWFIGPPIHQNFGRLLDTGDLERINHGVALYREYYADKGMFEAPLYEGVREMLAGLKENGHTLFVTTSKLSRFAIPVLEHHFIRALFQAVYGGEHQTSTKDKREIIALAMQSHELDVSTTVMVGDRSHDVLGAKHHGLRTIGVSYGYGTWDELRGVGADHIVSSPSEVVEALS